MPEIRLGAADNLVNIALGATELQEVRLGPELVWVNNRAPVITATTWGGQTFTRDADGVVEEGQVFSIAAGTDTVLTWTAQDMDMPPDMIAQFQIIQIVGGTTVEIVRATIPATGTTANGTYTVAASDATTYPQYQTLGDIAMPDTWIIRSTDVEGSEDDLSFMIDEVSFTAPTIAVTSTTDETLGTATFLSTATITQSASAIAGSAMAQYSTDGGTTWVNGATTNRSLSAACGNSSGWTVLARSVFDLGGPDEIISPTASGSGSISVSAPPVTVGVPSTGCTSIPGFQVSQTCAGVITAGTANLRARVTCAAGFSMPGGAAGTLDVSGTVTTLSTSGFNGWADNFTADYDNTGTLTDTITCTPGDCYDPSPTFNCAAGTEDVTCTFDPAPTGITYGTNVCTGTGAGSGDTTPATINGAGSVTATCNAGVVGVRSVAAIAQGTIDTQNGMTGNRSFGSMTCAVSCV